MTEARKPRKKKAARKGAGRVPLNALQKPDSDAYSGPTTSQKVARLPYSDAKDHGQQ